MSNGRKPNLRSSIYYSEADQRWHGRVTMGVKADGSPDRRHRSGKTQAEVTEKVRKLEAQRDAGKVDKPGRAPTVAAWMDTYLDTACERLVASGKMAPRTLDDYRSKTRLWIVPLLGAHRLDRLTPEHLDEAYSEMLAAGKSSSTVLKVHRILSRALTIAMRRDKVSRNVASRNYIDAPGAAHTEIEPFTGAEARRILGAAASRRNGARWSVALALGLRQGEALGLRWSYLDLETGVIRAWFQVQRAAWRHGCDDPNACGAAWHRAPCPRQCGQHRHTAECEADCHKREHQCPRNTCDPRTCVGHARHCPLRTGGGVTFRPRKGRSKLTLQCPPELLPMLKAHRKAQLAERLAAGTTWQDHDLVFAAPTGNPIDRSDDWREWKAVLRAAGVRDGRLHDARHTAGTLLIEQGVHIRVVQEILGHTRVTTTERYTHVASPQVRDASERLGAVLWAEG
ncbi:MAG TPA: tyrosine-type recombinase/integrase [Kribbellaceae bacterium]|nr:tyrosine-type recombinase/integrase [Kribbellaceae bacterium]